MAQAATEGQYRATHRFARISPQKARLVANMIRGLHVNDAQDILRFTPHKACGLIDKVLKSAIANASEQEADARSLFVSEIRIDQGPYFRRWRPKDRGRAHPIQKKMSHICVVVQEREK